MTKDVDTLALLARVARSICTPLTASPLQCAPTCTWTRGRTIPWTGLPLPQTSLQTCSWLLGTCTTTKAARQLNCVALPRCGQR